MVSVWKLAYTFCMGDHFQKSEVLLEEKGKCCGRAVGNSKRYTNNWFDYCHALYMGLPLKTAQKLQIV